MTQTYLLFLTIGGGLIFTTNVIFALRQLVIYLKNGKKNADVYFEKKVQSISEKLYQECFQRDKESREKELRLIKECITSELKPIKDDISFIKKSNECLRHTALTDLKIKLRELYNGPFEKKGMLSKIEKSNWDKWYSDYASLGGNSDIKVMNEQIQKIDHEITFEKQKAKVSGRKASVNELKYGGIK